MKHTLLSCIALLLLINSYGQNYSGTEFYFVFMANIEQGINSDPIFEASVYATADLTATLEYGLPDDPYYFSIQQTINQNEIGVFTFDFGQYLNQENLNVVESRSFRISTTEEARVYALHNRIFFSDASAILPTEALADEFMVTSLNPQFLVTASIATIIGVVDDTEITIIPSSDTPLGNAGDEIQLTLQAGEAISISSEDDLTGTRIFSSGNPISVFEGLNLMQFPFECGATSHLWEQALPVENWSRLYPIIPVDGNGGDFVKVVAAEDSTQLFLGCEFFASLNAGEYLEFAIDSVVLLSSTAPISLSAFLVGQSCSNLGSGDPNMRRILPLDRGNNEIKIRSNYGLQEFGPPFNGPRFAFLHLVISTDQIDNIIVNGEVVTGWLPVPELPSMSFTQLAVEDLDSSLSVVSESPFWAEYITMASFDAMSFSLGSDTQITIPDNSLSIVDLGPDQTLCPGETIVLENAGGGAGIWQDGSFQDSFLVSQPGSYSLYIEDACGSGFDEVLIGEGMIPTLSLPDTLQLCDGKALTIVLEAEPGVSYEWSTGAVGDTTEITQVGKYEVTGVSGDGCETTSTLMIVEGEKTFLEIIFSDILCEGDTQTITAFSDESGTFIWNDTITSSSLQVFEPGTYHVLFQPDVGSCSAQEEIVVRPEERPFLIGSDTTFCSGDSATITAFSPNGRVFWPGLSETASYTVSEFGAYVVMSENKCGTAEIEVVVTEKDCSCQVDIPSVFTPNGDGLNDLFIPVIPCEPEFFELVIFNRWGKQVFISNDVNLHWDGGSSESNEVLYSEGVYSYFLSYDNPMRPLKKREEMTGTITLIR